MAAPETQSPEAERKYHFYSSHVIPWYVHALWVSFWLGAIAYLLIYALPMVRTEVANPP
ncbi:MAG: hypothetical protein U0746_03345 [Gemmataceae bacterium]